MTEQSHAQTIVYEDAWLLGGVRTPFAAYTGTLRDGSATDLGIKAAREALKATSSAIVDGAAAVVVVNGNCFTWNNSTKPLARIIAGATVGGGGRHGIATACAGGGQGVAILIENPSVGPS